MIFINLSVELGAWMVDDINITDTAGTFSILWNECRKSIFKYIQTYLHIGSLIVHYTFYVHTWLSMTVLSTQVIDHIIWQRSYSKMKFIDLFLAISQRTWELPWCINFVACLCMQSENYPYLATPALGITVTTGRCNRNNPSPFRQAEKQPQHPWQVDNPPFYKSRFKNRAVYHLLRFEQLSSKKSLNIL